MNTEDDLSPIPPTPSISNPNITFKGTLNVEILKKFKELIQNHQTDLAVIGITLLTEVIEKSKATTMLELTNELTKATKEIQEAARNDLKDFPHFFKSSISLVSACELYQRFVTRQFLEISDFSACKQKLTDRGKYIQTLSAQTKERVSDLFKPFFSRDGMKVLAVGGYSEMVIQVLSYITTHMHRSVRFTVLIPEGRPDGSGLRIAKALSQYNIPCTIITDSALAYHVAMTVDFVLSGAEGVVESGGVINKIGTYQAAIIAKEHKKPFYVATESFKFLRQYPVNQQDLLEQTENGSIFYINTPEYKPVHVFGVENQQELVQSILTDDNITISNPTSDFTPPQYITMLFTDLGILTPSGVSDELIKLYS
ncbi:hypothetical protein ABK040_002404 [Willaertia magna]